MVNTVGAGGAMVAGFLAGYLENNDYRTALRLGIAAGSASVFQTEFASAEHIHALTEQIEIVQL